jgi:hypothetical protein
MLTSDGIIGLFVGGRDTTPIGRMSLIRIARYLGFDAATAAAVVDVIFPPDASSFLIAAAYFL